MLVGGASLLGQTLRERNETQPNICTIIIDAVGIAHPTGYWRDQTEAAKKLREEDV